jgi:hypothetical protein
MFLKRTRRFSYLPVILVFMMPQVIYSAILRLYFEKEVLRFPSASHNGANLDLTLVH